MLHTKVSSIISYPLSPLFQLNLYMMYNNTEDAILARMKQKVASVNVMAIDLMMEMLHFQVVEQFQRNWHWCLHRK